MPTLDSCEYRAVQQYGDWPSLSSPDELDNILEYYALNYPDSMCYFNHHEHDWYCIFMTNIAYGFWPMFDNQPEFEHVPGTVDVYFDGNKEYKYIPNCVIGADEIDIGTGVETGNTFACTCNGITAPNQNWEADWDEGYYWIGDNTEQFLSCNICVREPGGTTAHDNVYGKCFNGNPPKWSASEIRILQDDTRNPQYGYCCDTNAANYSGELACSAVELPDAIGGGSDLESFIPFPSQNDNLTIPGYYLFEHSNGLVEKLQRYHIDEGRGSNNTCPTYGETDIPRQSGHDPLGTKGCSCFCKYEDDMGNICYPYEMLVSQDGINVCQINTNYENSQKLNRLGESRNYLENELLNEEVYRMGRHYLPNFATAGYKYGSELPIKNECDVDLTGELNECDDPSKVIDTWWCPDNPLESCDDGNVQNCSGYAGWEDYEKQTLRCYQGCPDNSGVINKAIQEAPIGARVCLPAGDYAIMDDIVINRSDITLSGTKGDLTYEELFTGVEPTGEITRLYFGEKAQSVGSGENQDITKFSKIVSCLFNSLSHSPEAAGIDLVLDQLLDITESADCEAYFEGLLYNESYLNQLIEPKLQTLCNSYWATPFEEPTSESWRNSCITWWAQSNHNGGGVDDHNNPSRPISRGYGLYDCYGEDVVSDCKLFNDFNDLGLLQEYDWFTDCNKVGMNCNISICSTLISQAGYYGCFKSESQEFYSQNDVQHFGLRPSVWNMWGDYNRRACGGESNCDDPDPSFLGDGEGFYPFEWHINPEDGNHCDYSGANQDNYFNYPCGIVGDTSASGRGYYDDVEGDILTMEEMMKEFFVPGYCEPVDSVEDGTAGKCRVFCENGEHCDSGDSIYTIEEKQNLKEFYETYAVDENGNPLNGSNCTYYQSGLGDFECGYEKKPRDFCRNTCGKKSAKINVFKNMSRGIAIPLLKSGLNKSNYIIIKGDIPQSPGTDISDDAPPLESILARYDTSIMAGDEIRIAITMSEQVRSDHNIPSEYWSVALPDDKPIPMFTRTVTKKPERLGPNSFRITLDIPLRYKLPLDYNPYIYKVLDGIQNIGIENIFVSDAINYQDALYRTSSQPISITTGVKDVWVRDIYSFTDEDFAQLVNGKFYYRHINGDVTWLEKPQKGFMISSDVAKVEEDVNENSYMNRINPPDGIATDYVTKAICATSGIEDYLLGQLEFTDGACGGKGCGVKYQWGQGKMTAHFEPCVGEPCSCSAYEDWTNNSWTPSIPRCIDIGESWPAFGCLPEDFFDDVDNNAKLYSKDCFPFSDDIGGDISSSLPTAEEFLQWVLSSGGCDGDRVIGHVNVDKNFDELMNTNEGFVCEGPFVSCGHVNSPSAQIAYSIEDCCALKLGGKANDYIYNFCSDLGNRWAFECVDSSEKDYDKARDEMRLVFRDYFNVSEPKNVVNEPKHLKSGGIYVGGGARNVTVKNCIMKSPQNRGSGGRGYLFNISVANEVLVEDCYGYRGRHNFLLGGALQNSGIVLNRIKSEGGWAFSNTGQLSFDDDYWSRYQQLEAVGLGVPGLSDTHLQLNQSFLVTDSDLWDGFTAKNRQSLSSGAGITATEGVFWNIRTAPEDTPNPRGETSNVLTRWKTAAVPGMGALESYQFGAGYMKDVNVRNLFMDNNNPFDFLKQSISDVSLLVQDDWLHPGMPDYFMNSIKFMLTPIVPHYIKRWLPPFIEKISDEINGNLLSTHIGGSGGTCDCPDGAWNDSSDDTNPPECMCTDKSVAGQECSWNTQMRNMRCPGDDCTNLFDLTDVKARYNIRQDGAEGWLIELYINNFDLRGEFYLCQSDFNAVCQLANTGWPGCEYKDAYMSVDTLNLAFWFPIDETPLTMYGTCGNGDNNRYRTNAATEKQCCENVFNGYWKGFTGEAPKCWRDESMEEIVSNWYAGHSWQTQIYGFDFSANDWFIEDNWWIDFFNFFLQTLFGPFIPQEFSDIPDYIEEEVNKGFGEAVFANIKDGLVDALSPITDILNSDNFKEIEDALSNVLSTMDAGEGTAPNDYIYGGIGKEYSNWVCPEPLGGVPCPDPLYPQACPGYQDLSDEEQTGYQCIERLNSLDYNYPTDYVEPYFVGMGAYNISQKFACFEDGDLNGQKISDSNNDCAGMFQTGVYCTDGSRTGECMPDARYIWETPAEDCCSNLPGGVISRGFYCGIYTEDYNIYGDNHGCDAAEHYGCSYVGYYCKGDPSGDEFCREKDSEGVGPALSCGSEIGGKCHPMEMDGQLGPCICVDEDKGCIKSSRDFMLDEQSLQLWSDYASEYHSQEWNPNEVTWIDFCREGEEECGDLNFQSYKSLKLMGGTPPPDAPEAPPPGPNEYGYGGTNLYDYQRQYSSPFSSNDYNRSVNDSIEEDDEGYYKEDGVYQSPSTEHLNWEWYTEPSITGCTDENAWPNYLPNADTDDGSCTYVEQFYGTGNMDGIGTTITETDIQIMSDYIACIEQCISCENNADCGPGFSCESYPEKNCCERDEVPPTVIEDIGGERSSNGGNGGRSDDDMVTPDPGEDRRLGCVPEYLDLSLADFTQIGDLNGDGMITPTDLQILLDLAQEPLTIEQVQQALEGFEKLINFTLDNVIISGAGQDISTCFALHLLTTNAQTEEYVYGHELGWNTLIGGEDDACQVYGSGVEPTCSKIQQFFEHMTNAIPEFGIGCEFRIDNLIGYGTSRVCYESQEVGAYWSDVCDTGNYDCYYSGDVFTDDCDGLGQLDGNFKVGFNEYLETFKVIAERYGFCDDVENEAICDFINSRYCVDTLSEWCSIDTGCMDVEACNYDENAVSESEGDCTYAEDYPNGCLPEENCQCWEDVNQDGIYDIPVTLYFCPDQTCQAQNTLQPDIHLYQGTEGGVIGCTNPSYCEYDSSATISDREMCVNYKTPHRCFEDLDGDGDYESIIILHFCDDQYESCEDYPGDYVSEGNQGFVYGCTDLMYCNYNPAATEDDGSCFSVTVPSGDLQGTSCQDMNVIEAFTFSTPEYCPPENQNDTYPDCCGIRYHYCGGSNWNGETLYTNKNDCDDVENCGGGCTIHWDVSCLNNGYHAEEGLDDPYPREPLTVGLMVDNDWVTFDDDGNLVEIDLHNLGLAGQLPEELRYADKLQILNVNNNGRGFDGDFGGPIPQHIGDLKDLIEFKGAGNRWSGEIPRSMFPIRNLHNGSILDGGLQNLQILDLQGDIFRVWDQGLEDEFPSGIGDLPNLRKLALQRNKLGLTDNEIDTLKTDDFYQNLMYFWDYYIDYVDDPNSHYGSIPESVFEKLANMDAGPGQGKIEYFDVGTNNLVGRIPNSVCNFIENSPGLQGNHPYFSNNSFCEQMRPRCVTDGMFGGQESKGWCEFFYYYEQNGMMASTENETLIKSELLSITTDKNIDDKFKAKMVSKKIRDNKRKK